MKNWLLKKLLGKGTLRLAWRMVRDHDLPFDQALGRAVAAIYQEGSREAFEREKGRPPDQPEAEAGALYIQGVFERLL